MPANNQLVSGADVRSLVSGASLKWLTSDPGTTSMPDARILTSSDFWSSIKTNASNPFSSGYCPTWGDMQTYRKLQTSNYALRNVPNVGASAGYRLYANAASVGVYHTIEMWVRIPSASMAGGTYWTLFNWTGQSDTVIDTDPDTGASIYGQGGHSLILRKVSSGNFALMLYYWNDSATYAQTWDSYYNGYSGSGVSATVSIPADTWTHVAMTYWWNGGYHKFYINGSFVGQYNNGVTLPSGSPQLRFDGYGDDTYGFYYTPNWYPMDVDDIRVWNIDRTAAQIGANYNVHVAPGSTNLTYNWRLENDYTDSNGSGLSLSHTAFSGASMSFVTDTAF